MTDKSYRLYLYINFIVMIVLFLFFCCIQTAFLTQLFKASHTANLWVGFTVYIALFRRLPESLMWVYLSSFMGLIFSPHCPLSFFLISQIVVLFYVRFMSIFWKGGQHFVMFYSSGIVLFHISHYCLSLLLNFPSPSYLMTSNLVPLVFQVFWAMLIGYPIYKLLKTVDDFTKRSPVLVADALLRENEGQ